MMTPDLDLFIKAAGELAARRAEERWALDIIDPPFGSKHPRAADSLVEINRIIDRNGWGKNVRYVGNGPPQWCGMFAGDCWAEAGLDESWLPEYFASTYRLAKCWAVYERFDAHGKPNPAPSHDEPRRLITAVGHGFAPRFTPRRGDIVIVGDGDPVFGDHVTICVGWDAEKMIADTVSGNGGGVGPHGDVRDFRGGISRKIFAIQDPTKKGYRIMFVIRPAPSDVVNFKVDRQA